MGRGLVAGSASSAVGAILAHGPLTDRLLPVGLGLLGVLLARAVFISRQQRTTGQRAPRIETLSLTGIAMLITGVMTWDQEWGMSMAALMGLGIGWTAITLIDVLGKKVLKIFEGDQVVPPAPPAPVMTTPELVARLNAPTAADRDIPQDMLDALENIRVPGVQTPPLPPSHPENDPSH